jgi:DNA-binding transcriptional MerR regulator
MQIGIVAKKVGLSVDAIRFYERSAAERKSVHVN